MSKYKKKLPKSERPERANFVNVIWSHDSPLISIDKRLYHDKINFCGIDPGIEDLGISFQTYFKNESLTTSYIDCWKLGERITEEMDVYKIADQFLDSVKDMIVKCDFILIEKQLSESYGANLIMQHIITTCRIWCRNLPHLPYIIKVPPSLKGNMMGAPAYSNSKGLKIWARQAGYEYAYYKNDYLAAQKILDEINRGKGDDVSDVVLMTAAVFKKYRLKDAIQLNQIANNFNLSNCNLSEGVIELEIYSDTENISINSSSDEIIELEIFSGTKNNIDKNKVELILD